LKQQQQQTAAATAAAAAAAADAWTVCYDEDTDATYYFNALTQKAQMTAPAGMEGSAPAPQVAQLLLSPSASGSAAPPSSAASAGAAATAAMSGETEQLRRQQRESEDAELSKRLEEELEEGVFAQVDDDGFGSGAAEGEDGSAQDPAPLFMWIDLDQTLVSATNDLRAGPLLRAARGSGGIGSTADIAVFDGVYCFELHGSAGKGGDSPAISLTLLAAKAAGAGGAAERALLERLLSGGNSSGGSAGGSAGAAEQRGSRLLWLKVRPGCRRYLARMSACFGDRLFVFTHGSASYARRILAVIDRDGAIFGQRLLAGTAPRLGRASASEEAAAAEVAVAAGLAVPGQEPNGMDGLALKSVRLASEFAARFAPFAAVPAFSGKLVLSDSDSDGSGSDDDNATEPRLDNSSAPKPYALDARNCLVMDDRSDVWQWGCERPFTWRAEGAGGAAGACGNGLVKCLPYYFWGFAPPASEAHARDGLYGGAAMGGGEQLVMAMGGDDSTALPALATAIEAVRERFDAKAVAYRRQRATNERAQAAWRSWQQTTGGQAPAMPALPPLPPRADVRRVAAIVRRRVLSGCVIVFSGVISLHSQRHRRISGSGGGSGTSGGGGGGGGSGGAGRPEDSRYWKQAVAFGATCAHEMDSPGVTHLVAVRDGTAKVVQARGMAGKVQVVQLSWLIQSCARWHRVSEAMCPLLAPT